jgi:preprotein translocase subunit SecA
VVGRKLDPEEIEKPKIARNDRVTVKYQDGTRKEGVKYKTVMRDLDAGLCELLQPEE